MIIREFQLAELERARELQDEAAALHIPMPVMSWQFEVKDKDGNITEKGIGKANSYTRNALNLLAWYAGLAAFEIVSTSGFGDGLINYKGSGGTVNNFSSYSGRINTPSSNSDAPKVALGTGTTETLDDYTIPSYVCTTSISSVFNSTSRKLITTISGTYYNSSGSTINITESGIRTSYNASTYLLHVHDVFDAIALANTKTITWTYVTEVAYPNP